MSLSNVSGLFTSQMTRSQHPRGGKKTGGTCERKSYCVPRLWKFAFQALNEGVPLLSTNKLGVIVSQRDLNMARLWVVGGLVRTRILRLIAVEKDDSGVTKNRRAI